MKHDIFYAGKRKISTVTIIAIIVPIAASVVLLILSYCFLRMRARKKFDAVNEESLKKSDDVLIYHGIYASVLISLSFKFESPRDEIHY